MKLCSCGDEITAKDKRNKDGLQNKCNGCLNDARRLRYSLNPTKHRQRQKNYSEYANQKAKRHIETISDTYVIAELKRGTGLTTADIRKHPELIEAKRQLIKNYRLCRTLKNLEKI
jgi:hypothetical protein